MRPGRAAPAGLLVAALFSAAGVQACRSADTRSQQPPPELRREILIGRSLGARLAQHYSLLKNKEATGYVALVGQVLAAESSRPELQFHFGILRTEEVNAFACPGGYILITLGSLRMMQDESELAAVLAHEISHVSLMHAGEFDTGGSWIDFVADLVGAGGGNVLNTAVRQVSEELEKRLLVSGREPKLELESDQAGAVYAASAGYDPSAALRYLKRLGASKPYEILNKTHPPVRDRTSALNRFLTVEGVRSRGRRNKDRFSKFKAGLPAPAAVADRDRPGQHQPPCGAQRTQTCTSTQDSPSRGLLSVRRPCPPPCAPTLTTM